jgi:hypothetical protein
MRKSIKDAITAFEKVQSKHGNFGACDTEPDGQFQWIISQAGQGKAFDFKKCKAGWWEIFTSMPGHEKVARELTTAAKRVYDVIRKDARPEDIEALKSWTWRVCW